MTCTVYATPAPYTCEQRKWISTVEGYTKSETEIVNPSSEPA